jgi:hypothetical protein
MAFNVLRENVSLPDHPTPHLGESLGYFPENQRLGTDISARL